MGKLKNNQNGFGAIEGLLVLVIVVMIAGVGWYVYKATQKTNGAYFAATTTNLQTSPKFAKVTKKTSPTTSTTTVKTADPYAGWTSYTLSKEKLSFKYPSSLTISDTTKTADSGDSVTLSGSGGFKMYISTGLFDFSLPNGGATVDSAVPVTFAGQNGYIDLYEGGSQKTGVVNIVGLSKSATDPSDLFTSKNATTSSNGRINIDVQYIDVSGNQLAKSVSVIQNDPNYKNAVLIIGSMKY